MNNNQSSLHVLTEHFV